MGPGQFVRSWGLAIILGLASVGSWQAAKQRDTDEVSTEPVAYELSLTTPMLSARRVPRTLQAPVVDDRLTPDIQQIIAGSPPASCVMVRVGDRILEPSLNVSAGLVPASNQKILTTYAALVGFGPDFTFLTRVAAETAPDAAGVVQGNLYVIGDGDPFLSTDDWWTQYDNNGARYHTRLEDLADRIVASGITGVTGSVVGDESLFDTVRYGPWAQRLIDSKQSGPLSALSVNEGYAAWDQPYTSNRSRSETDSPPVYAAAKLTQLLQERNVAVGAEAAAGPTPAGAVEIASVESPRLLDILTHINSYSSNFGAEMLLKKLGSVARGVGSTQEGSLAVLDILAAEGIPTAGLTIADGSGLADGTGVGGNLVTCEALAAVLTGAGASSDFAATLAIAGDRGTLDGRFVDSEAEGQVYAKTGTLNDSTALSGYVLSRSDPSISLVFAYVANEKDVYLNQEVMNLLDTFVIDLTAYPGEPSIDALLPLAPSFG